MKLVNLHGTTSRRFVVNKTTRHRNIHAKGNRFGWFICAFVAVVVVILVLLTYFAVTFPLLEHKDTHIETLKSAKQVLNVAQRHIDQAIAASAARNISPGSANNAIIPQPPAQQLKTNSASSSVAGEYDTSNAISIRQSHISSVHLDAEPFLVGLGAEKSGSTSLGAAMFNSGEFTCPERDEIDVETKFWSNCYNWKHFENMDGILETLEQHKTGRCSIANYVTWNGWRNGKFKFEKSVDYLGLPYVTRIFTDMFVKPRGTKIFVMIRYPPPRIASTWKFFVGAEKDNMPNEYGNVEKFTWHLLKNEQLTQVIRLIDPNNPDNAGRGILQLDWTNKILPKWNDYMISLQDQCKTEAPIAGFKPEYCNPSQLLRRAVGLSCYVVPIMEWILDLGVEHALNSFRIIQSELYFKDGKNIMDRLICWSKQGTVDVEGKCDTTQLYRAGSVKIKKLQGTFKSKTSDFSDELIETLHQVFEPCHARLFELLQLYPQLALKEFEWQEWSYSPPT